MMLHSRADQLKFIAIETLRTINVLYTGDSCHPQNIQINKVVGENEKCFILWKKAHELFGQPTDVQLTSK